MNIDPACGSGHILVYAFDVLYDIYLKANYSERDIPQLILEKNLYGLDIDDRAGQLASFALMMKARSKNKRIFRKKIDLNVCSIQESNGLTKEVIDYFVGDNENLREDVEYLVNVFNDAKEYGSILNVKKIDFDLIEKRLEEIKNEYTLNYNIPYKEIIIDNMPAFIKQGNIISEKYEIVCTNPPYMVYSGMNQRVSDYVKKNYSDAKSDLFAVFIEKCYQFTKINCYQSMITQHSWMFLSSFTKLREKLQRASIVNMTHLGPRAFEEIGGEVVQTTSFVLRKVYIPAYKGVYCRLTEPTTQKGKENLFLLQKNRYVAVQNSFLKIPGAPIAYWASNKMFEIFETPNIDQYVLFRQGMATSDNNRFLRLWYEVFIDKINFQATDLDSAKNSCKKWFAYNKGGSFRKWYGNAEYIVNWENDGREMKEFTATLSQGMNVRLKSREYYFKECYSWSKISSAQISFRYYPKGYAFDVAGCCVFECGDYLMYYLALSNSIVTKTIAEFLSPTLNFELDHLKKIPLIKKDIFKEKIDNLTIENIKISKKDWDSFETSWDFQFHPLLTYSTFNNDFNCNNIETAFRRWTDFTNEQFEQLKNNEEELNRIFIEIYGLQDELTPEVEDKDITIRKADREGDIKSFISYAVGCMFGRYSLDEDGLIYAGGEFEGNRYKKFIPTTDNVLVIADDDYFEDDVVNLFVEFIKVTFGKQTLEENLDYIAGTLGVKTGETSRQAIRRYFLKDFYNDHIKTYQKRTIYWQFDSGKQNGFKALIYMHRYDSSTVARVRIDYLHKLQKKYEAEVKRLELMLESDLSTRDAAVARKKIDSIKKQIQECLAYDQVIAHVANQKVEIDLDDGVAVNYAKFQDIEVPQGEGKKPIKANLLTKI